MVLIVLLTGTLTNHVVDHRIRIDPHPRCSASLDHDTKLSTRSQAGVQSVADWLIAVWKVSTSLMDFSFEVKKLLTPGTRDGTACLARSSWNPRRARWTARS